MDKQNGSKKWQLGAFAATLGLVATCAPCCVPLIAPLITPLIAGSLAVFGLGAYVDDPLSWQGAASIAVLVGSTGFVLWRLTARFRHRQGDRRPCECTSTCHT